MRQNKRNPLEKNMLLGYAGETQLKHCRCPVKIKYKTPSTTWLQ